MFVTDETTVLKIKNCHGVSEFQFDNLYSFTRFARKQIKTGIDFLLAHNFKEIIRVNNMSHNNAMNTKAILDIIEGKVSKDIALKYSDIISEVSTKLSWCNTVSTYDKLIEQFSVPQIYNSAHLLASNNLNCSAKYNRLTKAIQCKVCTAIVLDLFGILKIRDSIKCH